MTTDRYAALRAALEAGPTRRAIPSLPGYEVDEHGGVWSVSSNWRGLGARLMQYQVDESGYRRVRVVANGRRTKKPIHQLVCEAFHGPKPDGHEVRHLNGNRQDNRPSNLAWGTRSENARDRTRHGTCKAKQNGLLGAIATKQKYSHLSAVIDCPICGRQFETRDWKVRSARRNGKLHTCSPTCARRVGADKTNGLRKIRATLAAQERP